jgi:predicted molibdopterin-dependent oxidoreductase YjgC
MRVEFEWDDGASSRRCHAQLFLILSEVEGRRLLMQRCKTTVGPSTALRSAQDEEKNVRGIFLKLIATDHPLPILVIAPNANGA